MGMGHHSQSTSTILRGQTEGTPVTQEVLHFRDSGVAFLGQAPPQNHHMLVGEADESIQAVPHNILLHLYTLPPLQYPTSIKGQALWSDMTPDDTMPYFQG